MVRYFSFDSQEEADPHIYPPSGQKVKRGKIVRDVKASGGGSLCFEIPSRTPADTSGSFWLNFKDDLSAQFGQRDEFYVQWRQRFSPEFLKTKYQGGGGWKQVIIGEGDRPGKTVYSCTQLEIVVVNGYHKGIVQMYHSCGGKDGQYEGLEVFDSKVNDILLQNACGCRYQKPTFPPCVGYQADQWMTFQVHVKIGTWYKNDKRYHRDSTIELWVAEEGKPSTLVISRTDYDIANNNPAAKYGKIWLLPYNTGKDASQAHATAYTWYDELIISKQRIPDPAVRPSPRVAVSLREGDLRRRRSLGEKTMTTALRQVNWITLAGAAALLLVTLGASPAADPPEKAGPETAMAKLAATMKPGQWAELKTENLIETHRAKGNSGAIFGYNEGAAWDPRSRQWLYVGGDHNDRARFVTYAADTNAWKVMPQPDWLGTTHGYDHNAIDVGRGVFYYRPFSSRLVYRYDIAGAKWSALPKIDTREYLACCVGVTYFPELDGLVIANGGGGKGHVFLFREKTQQWTMLAKDLRMGVYHNFAEYSPVHKVVIFGGGNGSNDLYKLDAEGKVATLNRAPIGVGTMQSIVTLDPVSGDFLVFGKNGSFYSYEVAGDTRKLQAGKAPIFQPTRVPDNKVWHVTAAPVGTYGVTMFVKYYAADPPRAWVYLYRHSDTKPAQREENE